MHAKMTHDEMQGRDSWGWDRELHVDTDGTSLTQKHYTSSSERLQGDDDGDDDDDDEEEEDGNNDNCDYENDNDGDGRRRTETEMVPSRRRSLGWQKPSGS